MQARIRILDSSCAEEVFNLHNEVYHEFSNNELYRSRDLHRISTLFESHAMCFGAYEGSRLVGYSGVRFPDPEATSISSELGFAPDRVRYIGEFDGSCVSSASRGQGLQYQLIVARARASLFRRRPMALATVAVGNMYSLINFLEYGMKGVALHQMYDGFARIIMARDHSDAIDLDNVMTRTIKGEMLKSEIADIFASGGQLVRVVRSGRTFTQVFAWLKGRQGSSDWVDTFNRKPLFDTRECNVADPIEFEGRWN